MLRNSTWGAFTFEGDALIAGLVGAVGKRAQGDLRLEVIGCQRASLADILTSGCGELPRSPHRWHQH